MTTRTITICDACGRDIMDGDRRWELVSPRSVIPAHFHDLRCLSEFVQGQLNKPKVVPITSGLIRGRGLNHPPTPFQHEEPKK